MNASTVIFDPRDLAFMLLGESEHPVPYAFSILMELACIDETGRGLEEVTADEYDRIADKMTAMIMRSKELNRSVDEARDYARRRGATAEQIVAHVADVIETLAARHRREMERDFPTLTKD